MTTKLFEFVVPGVPRSVQAKRGSQRWKNAVAAAATERQRIDKSLLDQELSAVIIYFHPGETGIDVDNVIKPILDALIGVIYKDDKLIAEVICRRTRLSKNLIVSGASPILAAGLAAGQDFVYVIIGDAPNHERIP